MSLSPGSPVQAECSVGACSGEFDLKSSLDAGAAAGADAARAAGFKPGRKRTYKTQAVVSGVGTIAVARARKRTRVSRAPKQFVDLQNDTTAADLELAVREGFRSIEHIKRYTALGFGTDQGKLGNINGMAIVAAALGENTGGPGHHDFPSRLYAGNVRRDRRTRARRSL